MKLEFGDSAIIGEFSVIIPRPMLVSVFHKPEYGVLIRIIPKWAAILQKH